MHGQRQSVKISLVLATKNRVKEVTNFVQSRAQQQSANFELIVVDQNKDDRVKANLIQPKFPFPILHLRSEPGLSRARNVGIAFATGDIIAFPDDDCWYPADLLSRVVSEFQSHPIRSKTGSPKSSAKSFHVGYFTRSTTWLEKSCASSVATIKPPRPSAGVTQMKNIEYHLIYESRI